MRLLSAAYSSSAASAELVCVWHGVLHFPCKFSRERSCHFFILPRKKISVPYYAGHSQNVFSYSARDLRGLLRLLNLWLRSPQSDPNAWNSSDCTLWDNFKSLRWKKCTFYLLKFSDTNELVLVNSSSLTGLERSLSISSSIFILGLLDLSFPRLKTHHSLQSRPWCSLRTIRAISCEKQSMEKSLVLVVLDAC